MGKEQEASKNPLRKLIRRAVPASAVNERAIAALSADQKKVYPHVIYQLESNSPIDQELLQASYEAMRNANFAVAIDIENGSSDHKVIVRTGASERRDQAVESALFLGLTEATRSRIESQAERAPESLTTAHEVAGQFLGELIGNEELYKSFREYYGGLRWGTDQEKFIRTLFVHGTDFDPDFIAQNLHGRQLVNLTYHLDIDLSYKETQGWYQTQPEVILAKFPELDYRRLSDQAFRTTPEGQKLMQAYRELSGDMLANQNKRGLDRNITEDGREIPRPQIPLSRHPIIEALVVNEVAVDRPKAKYDFGPSDLTDIILDSDSRLAHEALVTSISIRLPEGYRRVSDGPNEFKHKHRNICSVLRAYKETLSTYADKEAYASEARRELLRADLVRIMDAFTGTGVIASSVREENVTYRKRSRSWNSDGEERDSSDVYKVKDIARDLIKIGITAPDGEIVARAEDLIAQYIPVTESEVAIPDTLALGRTDLILVLLDSIDEMSVGSHPDVLARVGTRVFGNETIGTQIRGFAEAIIQAIQMRNTPDVLLALKELRKYGLSLGDKKSPEEVEARRHFEDLVRPADQLAENVRQAKNQLLLALLGQIAESKVLTTKNFEAAKLFEGLVKRVEFRSYQTTSLPQEYHALITLANNPNLSERQRNDVLWHMQTQFEYMDSKSTHLLVPVVLDLLQIALGPVDAVRLPTDNTDHGVAAISYIVSKHGDMFKAASQEQLRTIGGYARGIIERANQIGLGALLVDSESKDTVDLNSLNEWQKETLKNLSDVMRQLRIMKQYYEQYLRIEAVKVDPSAYYPWLLEQLAPFWQKMQWEVSPGKRPSREIQELYRVLADHVQHRLVIRKPEEYEADFDVVEQGHLDTLLREGYERMVVPHDIKYNTTVWQDGLGFMHSAVAFMPEKVLEQIKAKYPNSRFVEYLKKERQRWVKEGDE